ncbi:ADP-ribose pyrophosphatase [Planctomycetes bacterium Poly30]|uniref:GDP-mannose pyrophosphatase n=1 Tax=Saltatorellus ferox TaxID=2528018 RepID=A0A518ES34_9BACT|nr:ADP-ribose pyrophosphatase [Planctomycetes bacterium Poly30]
MSDSKSGRVPENPAAFLPLPVASSTRVYDSDWVGLRRDMLRLENGELQEHHVIEIPDAVCVLPITTQGEIVFIGQYRHPHGKTHWEVPAGRIEPGESPEAGAARELLEETGYRPGRLVPLPGFHPTNGISAHWSFLYGALDCEKVADQSLDPGERMVVQTFSSLEAEALLKAGRLQDGFTALALMYGRLLLPELQRM